MGTKEDRWSVIAKFCCPFCFVSNSMFAQLLQLQGYQWYNIMHRIDVQSAFEPPLWLWLWIQQSNLFHKTLQFMVMYHWAKFSCKRINNSEATVETITCGTDLIESKVIFWHWLMMMHHFTSLAAKRLTNSEDVIQTITVTMALNTAKQSFHKTLSLIMMSHQNLVVSQKIGCRMIAGLFSYFLDGTLLMLHVNKCMHKGDLVFLLVPCL